MICDIHDCRLPLVVAYQHADKLFFYMKLLHACKMFHVVVKPADDMARPRLSFAPGSRISTR